MSHKFPACSEVVVNTVLIRDVAVTAVYVMGQIGKNGSHRVIVTFAYGTTVSKYEFYVCSLQHEVTALLASMFSIRLKTREASTFFTALMAL